MSALKLPDGRSRSFREKLAEVASWLVTRRPALADMSVRSPS